MTDDIATALATMTGDNLLDTDRWEICKQQSAMCGGRAAEGQRCTHVQDATCLATEGSPLAMSNFPFQHQSKKVNGKGTGEAENPSDLKQIKLNTLWPAVRLLGSNCAICSVRTAPQYLQAGPREAPADGWAAATVVGSRSPSPLGAGPAAQKPASWPQHPSATEPGHSLKVKTSSTSVSLWEKPPVSRHKVD